MELFSLRLLLHHVPGAINFVHLRTVNEIVYPTFQAACIELGLLEDESELDKVMEEAFLIQFGDQLRSLFCSILLYSTPSNPLKFWESHREKLAEDWMKAHGKLEAINMVLDWLENRLAFSEISLKALGLPGPDTTFNVENGTIIAEELNYDKIALQNKTKAELEMMNKEQKLFF